MTTGSPTEQYDEQIAAARFECERLHEAQRAAHEHCERVRAHRIETRGGAAAAVVEVLPDLAELRRQYVAAVQALQDAQLARHDARQRLDALLAGRAPVERREILEHLTAMLALEAAEARVLDAAIEALVAAAQGFLATNGERANCSRALGLSEAWSPAPAELVVARVMSRLRMVAGTEFTSAVRPTQPLVQVQLEMTTRARAVVAQAQGET